MMFTSMRRLVYWDADSFFASVEQASDRRLRNRPVAVGGAGRGVVLSASPEARRFGIRPGMPTGRARRACRALIMQPAHFELYERFHEQLVGLSEELTPLVEPVRVGAALLDLTGSGRVLKGGAEEAARRLAGVAREWLRISLSSGVASVRCVAQIAARLGKPGGLVEVPAGEERGFLAPLPLRYLPGVGEEIAGALEAAGARTIGEVADMPLGALVLVAGQGRAVKLQRLAQGADAGLIHPAAAAPRFTESEDFPGEAWEEPLLLHSLRRMLDRLMAGLRSAGLEARRLTLCVRYTDRAESERSLALAEPTCWEADLYPLLPGLLHSAWQRRVRVRALRLAAGRLYRPVLQPKLFAAPDAAPERKLRLAAVIDRLHRQFGPRAVQRAWQLAVRENSGEAA